MKGKDFIAVIADHDIYTTTIVIEVSSKEKILENKSNPIMTNEDENDLQNDIYYQLMDMGYEDCDITFFNV